MRQDFRRYYMTYGLLVVIWVIFALMTLAGGSTRTSVLVLFGAKVNQLIDAGQYWRLLTCVFLHIGLTHILFNSYSLLILGRFCEDVFGHARFLVLFLCAGIGGSTLSYLLLPNISAGASGAIFGFLGAILAYGWDNRAMWRAGILQNFLIILALNFIMGLSPGSSVDNYGHLGGLIAGLLVGYIFRLLKRRPHTPQKLWRVD